MVGREAFAEALLGLLEMHRKGLAQRTLAEIVRSMRWDGTCPLSRDQLVERVGGGEGPSSGPASGRAGASSGICVILIRPRKVGRSQHRRLSDVLERHLQRRLDR